jgi:transcriptional regulator with XRE-family HTH domain
MHPLGVNLKILRRKKNLNQDEMLTHIGISRTTWSNYETDYSEPDHATLINISNFFDISIDDLLKKNLYQEDQNDNLSKFVGRRKKGQNDNLNDNPTDNLNPFSMGVLDQKEGQKEPCQECALKDRTIEDKQAIIEALKGQIEALKLATGQMEARLKDTPGAGVKKGK